MTDFPISDSIYQHKTRIRVCGLLESGHKILLIKHDRLGPAGYMWAPPGGGVSFGSSVKETLIREFKEETNLDIEIEKFLFVNEYKDSKYHAVELFFKVIRLSGELKLGIDPEVPSKEQILMDIKFMEFDDISSLNPDNLHNCFRLVENPQNIFEINGFFKFDNI